jgi:hypothetical protein
MMPTNRKPHIRKRGGMWYCSLEFNSRLGCGRTPLEAYKDYKYQSNVWWCGTP